MSKLVECIPNFSCSKEKDEAAYNALVEVANSVPGCTLFDAQTDGNHNRCVFTMIGSPEAIEEVAFQLTKKASEVIDMTKHVGEHSRMGATDVIPFVPTMGVTVEECVEMSKRLGQRIWDELKIPSFLYEDSATRPERRNLATCRKGQFEGRRHHRHRRPHAPGGLQREPGHLRRGDRQEDRQGHPRLLRRLPQLQGHGLHAGGPGHRSGLHEHGQL